MKKKYSSKKDVGEGIGDRVKKIRIGLKLTQAEFSEKIGLKQSFLSAVELGKFSLSRSAIISISHLFKISPEWLETGEGEMYEKIEKRIAQVITDDSRLADLIEMLAEIYRSGDIESLSKIMMDISEVYKELKR